MFEGLIEFKPGDTRAQPFLKMEDNGPGVPVCRCAGVPVHERMLERFYRVTGTAGEGSGLGLAIAEEIARGHNSQLLVLEGYGGWGVRMRLCLPA